MYAGVEYTMNQLTGGWWSNRLYRSDPDLVVLGKDWIQPELDVLTKLIGMDSRSRVNKAVVMGGLFLNGDDLTNSTNVALVQQYFGNERVNAVFRLGKTFRPLHLQRDGVLAARLFEIDIGNHYYMAVF